MMPLYFEIRKFKEAQPFSRNGEDFIDFCCKGYGAVFSKSDLNSEVLEKLKKGARLYIGSSYHLNMDKVVLILSQRSDGKTDVLFNKLDELEKILS